MKYLPEPNKERWVDFNEEFKLETGVLTQDDIDRIIPKLRNSKPVLNSAALELLKKLQELGIIKGNKWLSK